MINMLNEVFNDLDYLFPMIIQIIFFKDNCINPLKTRTRL